MIDVHAVLLKAESKGTMVLKKNGLVHCVVYLVMCLSLVCKLPCLPYVNKAKHHPIVCVIKMRNSYLAKKKPIGIYFKKVLKQWVSNHFTVTSESLTLCWYECVLAFLRYSVLKTGLVPHFILHILLIQPTSVCVRPVKKACIMSFPPSLLSPVA